MDIEKLRKKIDAIDSQIVSLLEKRALLAKEIGKLKKKARLPVTEIAREQEILRKISSRAKILPKKYISDIYTQILSACRAVQAPVRVSFLGPLGTFSHIAAAEYFGSAATLLPQPTVEEVFKSAEKGEADFAVVAIENSSEGSIASTLDLLLATNLLIVGEKNLPVRHNLLAKKGTKLENIKHIYGHPQALSQCKKFLDSLPAEKHEVSSTAQACSMLGKNSGAVASSLAARIYHLSILKSNIQNSANNITRFIILGKQPLPPTGRDKTSIIFSVQDKPGALHSALGVFSRKGINLTKIESRPSRQKQWEYLFYADFEGHREKKICKEALKELEAHSKFLKILGSYPAAQ